MATAQNQLIAQLPVAERRRLLAACKSVQLVLAEVLQEPDSPTRYVYFPVDGFVSQVTQTADHPSLEVGMIGREGMLGIHIALGVRTAPVKAVVQGPGAAWRIDAAAFVAVMAKSPGLQRILDRYTFVLFVQLQSAAACLRFHSVGQRLARWLLMSQDCAHANSFFVTQEFLSYMIGARRVGVTTAAVALQRRGLISYRRGYLTVLNRTALQEAACGCYCADRSVYAKHLR